MFPWTAKRLADLSASPPLLGLGLRRPLFSSLSILLWERHRTSATNSGGGLAVCPDSRTWDQFLLRFLPSLGVSRPMEELLLPWAPSGLWQGLL